MRYFIIFLAAVLCTGCPNQNLAVSGGAGVGAEFDPSQYYTKTEIDQKLADYALKSELAKGQFRYLYGCSDQYKLEFTVPANTITKGILIMGCGGVYYHPDNDQTSLSIDLNSKPYVEFAQDIPAQYSGTFGLMRWIDNVDWTVDNNFRVLVGDYQLKDLDQNICVFGY